MIDPTQDGIDHINIYSKGKTDLGQQLSNFYRTVFILPDHGMFKSVEGYWFWLATGMRHISLRYVSGHFAKAEGSKLEKFHVEGFEEKIKAAISAKINQNPDLERSLKESTLPLEHYYCYGKDGNYKLINLPKYRWMVDHIEDIRRKLQST